MCAHASGICLSGVSTKRGLQGKFFLDTHLYNYCHLNLILQIIKQNSWQV